MSLHDKVLEWYEKASTSLDPCDWAVYHALAAAERAESDALLLDALIEPADPAGISTPEEAGYPSEVHILRDEN